MENSHEKNQRKKEKKKKDRKFHSLVECACTFFQKIKNIN